MVERRIDQSAPWPSELEDIVTRLQYRPGWEFELAEQDRGQGSVGLTFKVLSLGYNTYHPERGESYGVWHYFPVPPASFNRASWLRWVLDRLIEVETHEACEFLQLVEPVYQCLADGDETRRKHTVRPFAPNHGPGWDPYIVRELNTVQAAETTFRGERREGTQG